MQLKCINLKFDYIQLQQFTAILFFSISTSPPEESEFAGLCQRIDLTSYRNMHLLLCLSKVFIRVLSYSGNALPHLIITGFTSFHEMLPKKTFVWRDGIAVGGFPPINLYAGSLHRARMLLQNLMSMVLKEMILADLTEPASQASDLDFRPNSDTIAIGKIERRISRVSNSFALLIRDLLSLS